MTDASLVPAYYEHDYSYDSWENETITPPPESVTRFGILGIPLYLLIIAVCTGTILILLVTYCLWSYYRSKRVSRRFYCSVFMCMIPIRIKARGITAITVPHSLTLLLSSPRKTSTVCHARAGRQPSTTRPLLPTPSPPPSPSSPWESHRTLQEPLPRTCTSPSSSSSLLQEVPRRNPMSFRTVAEALPTSKDLQRVLLQQKRPQM